MSTVYCQPRPGIIASLAAECGEALRTAHSLTTGLEPMVIKSRYSAVGAAPVHDGMVTCEESISELQSVQQFFRIPVPSHVASQCESLDGIFIIQASRRSVGASRLR